MDAVEQSFLDEVAAGKDLVAFRLELFKRAKGKPVGNNNEYDLDRYAGVLKLVPEKSDWEQLKTLRNVGVSAYFCHNSYVANVLDLEVKEGQPPL
jgi:hypothetical protein